MITPLPMTPAGSARRARAPAVLLIAAMTVACTQRQGPTPPATGPTAPSPAAADPSATVADPLGWARDAVFYEVFVRSFADSDGDGIGDLRGLIDRLDYLNDGRPGQGDDLEVDALWLMPIFESPSYHGYDVIDFRAVERDYGELGDLQDLLRAAHRRRMRIIIDLPLNHTSVDHPWFTDAARGPAASKRGWYLWSERDPGWKQPWSSEYPSWHRRGDAYYYGVFWSGMPDLNYRSAAVRAEIEQVARHWLRLGVDGFRLDAVRHLVEDQATALQSDSAETHAYLRGFSAAVRRTRPEALLVGEIWSDAATIAPYFGSREQPELPMAFDFPFSGALLQALRSGDARPIRRALVEAADRYPSGALSATFITNHDMIRVATQLDGKPRQLRLAAALLLALPGVPFVYYGEELGMHNGPGGADEEKRTPMPWSAGTSAGFSAATPWRRPAPGWEQANVAAQTGDGGSLLSLYRRLIRLRHQHTALRRDAWRDLSDDAQPALLLLERAHADERLLVAVNLGADPIDVAVHLPALRNSELIFYDAAESPPDGPIGQVVTSLPSSAAAIWRLR